MPRIKQFNQEEVLRKAMELFWKNGYHATSIQHLVDHLGINRASLYDTFGGKKELFLKSFQLYLKSNSKGFSDFLNSQSDVKKGLRMLFQSAWQESIADVDRKGCYVVNTTTELVPGDDEVHQILDRNKHNFEEMFYNYLQKGVEKGQLSPDKDYRGLASLFFTYYNGLKVIGKIGERGHELHNSIDLTLSLLD